ncbi:hypothetical protein SD81_017220 [Tolypothrix campylonemoides VB511288]|nr:hypothetical protein SD81_017220 [Tolypothrix campylonemoides VB511288]
MKAKYVKNHVSTYGKQIVKATNQKFGINNALIVRAINGDEKALTQIGDMGKTGERLLMAMPTIRENLKAYIDGTKEYNTALADIYKTGSKGSLAIDKAAGDMTLENTRFNHLMEEYKTKLFSDLEKEHQRHDDALDVIELTAWVDAQMTTVEAKASLEGISNKPFIAQMKADRDFEDKKIQHLLENGSDSDLNLIPRKHYSTNPIVKLWNQVREIFS